MKKSIYIIVLAFLFLSPAAHAANIFFPKQTFSSARCVSFSNAVLNALQRIAGKNEVLSAPSILSTARTKGQKNTMRQFNMNAHRNRSKLFLTIMCSEKANHTIEYALAGWKVVPPDAYNPRKIFKSEVSGLISFANSQKANGKMILRGVLTILKSFVGTHVILSTAIHARFQKIIPAGEDAIIGKFLPLVDKVIVGNFSKDTTPCGNVKKSLIVALSRILGARLIVARSSNNNATTLNNNGYSRNAEVAIHIGCTMDIEHLLVHVSLHKILRIRKRMNLPPNTSKMQLSMTLSKKTKAFLIATFLKRILDEGIAHRKMHALGAQKMPSIESLSKEIVRAMPHSTRVQVARYRILKKEKEMRRLRIQRKKVKKHFKVIKKAMPVPKKPSTGFDLVEGIGLGGGMYYLDAPTFLGCVDVHIMYKPIRLGIEGSVCVGSGPFKKGYDIFFSGGLSVLVFTLPSTWNISLTASITFNRYLSEMQDYEKGVAPFATHTGIGVGLDLRVRPHPFFSFGLKGIYAPGIFEQRTLSPQFKADVFMLSVYASVM